MRMDGDLSLFFAFPPQTALDSPSRHSTSLTPADFDDIIILLSRLTACMDRRGVQPPYWCMYLGLQVLLVFSPASLSTHTHINIPIHILCPPSPLPQATPILLCAPSTVNTVCFLSLSISGCLQSYVRLDLSTLAAHSGHLCHYILSCVSHSLALSSLSAFFWAVLKVKEYAIVTVRIKKSASNCCLFPL